LFVYLAYKIDQGIYKFCSLDVRLYQCH